MKRLKLFLKPAAIVPGLLVLLALGLALSGPQGAFVALLLVAMASALWTQHAILATTRAQLDATRQLTAVALEIRNRLTGREASGRVVGAGERGAVAPSRTHDRDA